MRILLSTINVKRLFTPLALLYLKASLLNDRYLKEKIEVKIEEFSLFNTDDFILHKIQKYNPGIIGFSCYVWNINRILALSRDIKKINKNIKIILGGPQVSPIAKNLLEKNSQIHIIVKGEGERTFLELIKSLSNSSKDINKVSGITYRHKGGIIDNADRKNISDLNSIPSPYFFNFINLEGREACLETQRGCIFKCHFCYYGKGFDRLRFFSTERVKKELSFLLNQELKCIYLMDPVFNVNINRAKEICKFIAQNNKKNIEFHTEIRAELVDEKLAELFHKANIKFLEIGLQSSEDKVLRLINRKLNTKKFINGVNLLKKYDLMTEIQLIVGLPGETLRSFKKSLEFILDLEPKSIRIARLQVLPGTKIWNEAKNLGIIYEEEPPHYFLRSKTFSFKEAVQTQKIINSLEFFQDNIAVKYICKETKTGLLDFINLWIKWSNDDGLLLNPPNRNILKDKIKEFIKYFCEENKIDFDFYGAFVQKQIKFGIKNGMGRIEAEVERYYGK